MDMTELKKKSTVELNKTLTELLRKQFRLRLMKVGGELTKTHQLKQVRRDIARLLTILHKKKGDKA